MWKSITPYFLAGVTVIELFAASLSVAVESPNERISPKRKAEITRIARVYLKNKPELYVSGRKSGDSVELVFKKLQFDSNWRVQVPPTKEEQIHVVANIA